MDLINLHHKILLLKRSITNLQKSTIWTQIAAELNSLGQKKTVVQWKRCLVNMRKSANKKVFLIDKYRRRTNNKPKCPIVLTEQDEIIISIYNKTADSVQSPLNGTRNIHLLPSLKIHSRQSIAEHRPIAQGELKRRSIARKRKDRANSGKQGARECYKNCDNYRRGSIRCGSCFLSSFKSAEPPITISKGFDLGLERKISLMCEKQDEIFTLIYNLMEELIRSIN